jgi:hypothetical protein
MSTALEPILADLVYIPYIDDSGELPAQLQRQIGVYAIFNEVQALQLVDYSRDIFLSLKQHLIRQPAQCFWVKAHVIEKPNRTELEAVKAAWITGKNPPGNGNDIAGWQDSIDCRYAMTPAEEQQFPDLTETNQSKLLKQVCRRVEAEIVTKLQARGLTTEIRFNPKAKERGLLDL